MAISDYNSIFAKSFQKQLVLDFGDGQILTNEDIAEESMVIEEALCSEENLRFGACESSCFKIRVFNSGSFEGKTVEVLQTLVGISLGHLIDSDGNNLVTDEGKYLAYYDASNVQSTTISLGTYRVYSDRPSNDRMWRDLVCYDVMYDILNADVADWYDSLTFPMTIKQLRDSFFSYLQITQETTTLINDSFVVQGGFSVDGVLSGKTIIEAICEINGVFGHMSRGNVFQYISLPSAEVIPYEWYVDDTGDYEDYETETITKIIARDEDSDVGTSVGTDGNTLIIESNPLIYGTEGTAELTTALTSLLGAISTISYRPFSVETYGNPMLPVGTSIIINTRRFDSVSGNYISFSIHSFVMSRILSGIQALRDSLSADGDKYRPSEVNSLQTQITRVRGKVHKVTNTVDELTSEIYEVDPQTGTKSSKIQQLSDQIVLQVDSNGKVVRAALSADPSTGDTHFSVEADRIDFTSFELNMNTTNFKLTSSAIDIDSNGIVVKGSTFETTIQNDTFKIENKSNSNSNINIQAKTFNGNNRGFIQLYGNNEYGLFTPTEVGLRNSGNVFQQCNLGPMSLTFYKPTDTSTLLANAPLWLGVSQSGSVYSGMITMQGANADITNDSNWIGSTKSLKSALSSVNSTASTASTNASNALTKIGTLGPTGLSSTPGDITVSTSAWKSVAALNNLAAGKYLLIGSVRFAAQSGGHRYIVITTTNAGDDTSDRNSKTSQTDVANAQVMMHAFKIINISSATTYHLNAYQTSGSNVTANAKLVAIRIGA